MLVRLLVAVTLAVPGAGLAQSDEIPFMNAVVDAAKSACGGKGSEYSIRVKGGGSVEASKIIAQLVGAKLSGEAEFSKSEWDGISAMTKDSANYAKCIQHLVPLFLDRFKKKG